MWNYFWGSWYNGRMGRPMRIEYRGACYHVMARGVEKREIFEGEGDYRRLLYFPEKFAGRFNVLIYAYALMPNHFHLLLKLKTKYGMSKLLSVVCSCFTAYYNEKYEAEGSVWQGTYRAVRVFDPRQYLHLSRYIHINPYPTVSLSGLMDCPSSYSAYVGRQHIPWLITEEILGYFAGYQKSTSKVYKSFVEEYLGLQGDDREEEEMFLDGLKLE